MLDKIKSLLTTGYSAVSTFLTAWTTGNKWVDAVIIIAIGAYLLYWASGLLYWAALIALVLVVLSSGTAGVREWLGKARDLAEDVVDTVRDIDNTTKTVQDAEKTVDESKK